MKWQMGIVRFSVNRPRLVMVLTAAALAFSVGLGVYRGARTDWEIVDTDPENMLAADEPVRRFHDATKKEFSLHDMIVLGIVNETDPDGVFNPGTLSRVLRLTDFIKGLAGVVAGDLIAPSDVDSIEQAGPGTIRFERLMAKAPASREEARLVRDRARNHPMLYGTLVSEDGKALCVYVPIREKKLSHRISGKIRAEAGRLGLKEMDYASLAGGSPVAGDAFGITGLPVAEDTFGVEMFAQMAVSAPLAMLVIFILLLLFFRKLVLVISPMIVAMASVLFTMGLLVGLGYTVHIMSSMIPIFIMPIAVEDSVHILSQFFERYRKYHDPKKTILAVMEELFSSMLFTSLTTIAGFASLALTPIPPVQTFGIFIALGVASAWVLTVTFVPAYVTFIPTRRLETFGAAHGGGESRGDLLTRPLLALGRFTYRRAKLILGATAVVVAVSAYGISLLRVNDNPTNWFGKKHPIRVADRVLNAHFGGTYMAYLILEPAAAVAPDPAGLTGVLQGALAAPGAGPEAARRPEILGALRGVVREKAGAARTQAELVEAVDEWCVGEKERAGEAEEPLWKALLDALSEERARADMFKRPEMLRYLERLEKSITESRLVGKTNSPSTIVKHVHRELRSGAEADFVVPATARMAAECYLQAQGGHDPEDLWKLVVPDYGKANIWVQLKSGDNRDMERVARAVGRFMAENPPPVPLSHRWAGLTYVNVIWQDKMVAGMMSSLMGSFVMVFLMMAFLFRSLLWGALSMIPLSVTIAFIYAMIGFAGKDYDMPVAVLSSLTLGLSVDFSIHYLNRCRELFASLRDWRATAVEMAGETARAIAKNVVVIAVGFMPLLFAPLVPYQTVGFFMTAIMIVSGVGTLLILPAFVTVLQRALFAAKAPAAACSCGACMATAVMAVAAVGYVLHQYRFTGWTATSVVAGALLVASMLACNRLARRQACAGGGGEES